MKFKIDENLPIEVAEILIAAGHDATTINAQHLQGVDDPDLADACVRERRVLVTLDLDFADIRAYPPHEFPGFIVMRLGSQSKRHILRVLRAIAPLIAHEPIEQHLWIVEETGVRIRE